MEPPGRRPFFCDHCSCVIEGCNFLVPASTVDFKVSLKNSTRFKGDNCCSCMPSVINAPEGGKDVIGDLSNFYKKIRFIV